MTGDPNTPVTAEELAAGCVKWKVRSGRVAYDWITGPDHLPPRLRGHFCSVEEEGEMRLGERLGKP
jgi:hypothetical protein